MNSDLSRSPINFFELERDILEFSLRLRRRKRQEPRGKTQPNGDGLQLAANEIKAEKIK
jgi:hypothetical protein